MKRIRIVLAAFFVLCVIGGSLLPTVVFAVERNKLEIIISTSPVEPSGFSYAIKLYANKMAATTCELQTPKGTYNCEKGAQDCEYSASLDRYFCQTVTDSFIPTPESKFYENHKGLTFGELTTEIATAWTLTWDKNLSTKTTATITLGPINITDFLPNPQITTPTNGSSNVSPSTNIAWTYAVPTNEAQKKSVGIDLIGPNNVRLSADEFPLLSTSWTPSSPLVPGKWLAYVRNSIPNFRRITGGIGEGVSVAGDAWLLQNGDWLELTSGSDITFTVEDTPIAPEQTDNGGGGGGGGCFINTASH